MTNPRIAPTAGHGTAAKTSHALEDPFPTPLGPVAPEGVKTFT